MRYDCMKVFISWSGDVSLKVATVFRDWLPSVIQSLEPYVSSEDIDKGARWSSDIAKELENSTFGILCVTKENLEAPWLSFEAGALSKTMDKSFVNPFLFDIKRSEVQGPILQFQSTIFEKEDIKRMMKTLNKACGDSGILENRLDNSFDVWYPQLEKEFNKIKQDSGNVPDVSDNYNTSHSGAILEEILELSRDNQKLLRNPDSQLRDEIEKIKQEMEQVNNRNAIIYDKKRVAKKYTPMLLEEIMHKVGKRSSYGFLMTLSLFKDDFPWIYDMGKELLDILKSDKLEQEKALAIREFRNIVDFTCGHPMMLDIFGDNKGSMMMLKEMPFILMRYMDDMFEQYK